MVRGPFQLPTLVSRRVKILPYTVKEFLLNVTVFEPALAIAIRQLGPLLFGQKQGYNCEEIAFVWVFGVCHGDRIGDNPRNFPSELFLFSKNLDGIVIGFTHLPTIYTQNGRNIGIDFRFRNHKGLAKHVIKLDGYITCNFKMLLLILPHGDPFGLVKENICSHEHGIRKETMIGGYPLGDLILVGVASKQ